MEIPNSAPKTTRHQSILFSICFVAGIFAGITSSLMSAYLPDVLRTFGIQAQQGEHIGAIIASVFLFGMTAGGLALGYYSDLYGRKNAFLASLGFVGIFTFATAYAPNWQWVAAFRFFSGFGASGILLTTAILVAEAWHTKSRSIALGILSISFPIGIFSAGLITYSFSNWREGFWVGIVCVALAVVAHYTINESQEWQAKKGIKAQKSVQNKRSLLPKLAYGSLIYGSMLIGLWAVFSWLPTWVQTIAQPEVAQKVRGLSMMLFAVGGLVGGFFSGWIGRYLGIKTALLWCFFGCFVLSIVLFLTNAQVLPITYIEMALLSLFFGLSQGLLNDYIPLFFDIEFRASATGICFNVGRIFTASVVFCIGWLVYALGGYGNALCIFSLTFLVGFVALFTNKNG